MSRRRLAAGQIAALVRIRSRDGRCAACRHVARSLGAAGTRTVPDDADHGRRHSGPALLGLSPGRRHVHFRWLREYDLPGVFLQRFTVNLDDDAMQDFRDTVARNVRTASESHGRVFAVMWDISGHHAETLVEDVQRDWVHVVETLRLLKARATCVGRPVLAIWGFGFTDRPASPQRAMRLIEFFKNYPDPLPGTLFGGIPAGWRTLTRDSQADPAWAAVYRAFDIISPWVVGRFRDSTGIEHFYADSRHAGLGTRELGIEYACRVSRVLLAQ